MSPLIIRLLLFDLLLSAVAFALYLWDKVAAKTKGRRVPEKTLHLIALFGGWPGALLAMAVFRHKTRKRSFQTVFRVAVLLNVLTTPALIVALAPRNPQAESLAPTHATNPGGLAH